MKTKFSPSKKAGKLEFSRVLAVLHISEEFVTFAQRVISGATK